MRFFDILQWTIIAAIVVVIVMNVNKDTGFLATFGSFWTQETSILTGAGYNTKTGGQYNAVPNQNK